MSDKNERVKSIDQPTNIKDASTEGVIDVTINAESHPGEGAGIGNKRLKPSDREAILRILIAGSNFDSCW